jgi:hypothetical protein
MSVRRWLLSGALALAMACGASQDTGEGSAAPEGLQIAGVYQVTGVTIGLEDGLQRPIHGSVKLLVEDGLYTAHVELDTYFPGSEARAARVVGTGDGRIEGRVLEGMVHTQLVAASVPGVDVGFAFVPREVGPRIRSRSRAEFLPEGSVHIELENQPEPGEQYRPTRTELVGYRREG